jgi:hypothetical protein
MIPDGLVWNEVELPLGHPLNRGLLSLCVIKEDLRFLPQLIGTAFIVQVDGNRAVAVASAHCFEEVRRILHPHIIHRPSTLREFLPSPKELDLKQVKGIYKFGDSVAVCTIELGVWDCGSDFALLTAIAPDESHFEFGLFRLDDTLPTVGDEVTIIGFGEMKVTRDSDDPNKGLMQRRLVARIGHVEGIYPEGMYTPKTPCVLTTIATFSGMSGGLVCRGWPSPNSPPVPFGFISHSMSLENPKTINDRSISGDSFGVIINMEIKALDGGEQSVGFSISNAIIGRTIRTD